MTVLRIACGFLAVIVSCFAYRPASAEEAAANAPFSWLGLPADRVDISSGSDITGASNSTFGTMIIAPYSALDKDGWRVKLFGAFSTYSYKRDHDYCKTAMDQKRRGIETRAPGINLTNICNTLQGTPSPDDNERISQALTPYGLFIRNNDLYYEETYEVTRYEAAFAPGYQFSVGGLVVKAWLGPGFERTATTPNDPSKSLNGTLWGAKGGVDAWMPLGENAWLAADGAYFTASERYSASLRLGLKPMSWLTIGPQLASFGDRDDTSRRAGGFLNFVDATGVETTLSAGWTDNYSDAPNPYGTASVYVKF